MTRVHPLSATSIYLESYFNDIKLSSATGFIITLENQNYLITNWHVVTGLNPTTNFILSETSLKPNRLKIFHRSTVDGQCIEKFENLYNENNNPRWKEHPLGQKVDVVALSFLKEDDIKIFAFNYSLSNTDMLAEPGMHVSIIGFPLGISSNGIFAVWKGGYIATDPDLDYLSLPLILIDATTREGMSGSPVFAVSSDYFTKNGSHITSGRNQFLFLGIYSGRENDIAELGRVWKADVIKEIFSS